MHKFVKSQLDRYFGQFAHRSDLENLRRQMACVAELQSAIPGPVPFGKLGGWTISADALAIIARDIRKRRSPTVVEFGSGVSTILLAALLRAMGRGRLITIEHDLDYLKVVDSDLFAHGLKSVVDLRHLPMVSFSAAPPFAACHSYDLCQLDAQFDVALVDGPITAKFGAATRLAPLEWCVSKLNPSGSIYLDDAERAEERQIVAALCALHPEIEVEFLDTEKGLVRVKGTHSAENQELSVER
jgi:predicted O-methyltransferase YrrM